MNLGYFLIFCATLTNGFLYNYPCLRGNTKLKLVIADDNDDDNNYWRKRIKDNKLIITDDNDGYWEERIQRVRRAANSTSRREQRRKTRYMERSLNRQLSKYNYIYDDFSFEPVINKSNYSLPV